jgi:hypothetical protein
VALRLVVPSESQRGAVRSCSGGCIRPTAGTVPRDRFSCGDSLAEDGRCGRARDETSSACVSAWAFVPEGSLRDSGDPVLAFREGPASSAAGHARRPRPRRTRVCADQLVRHADRCGRALNAWNGATSSTWRLPRRTRLKEQRSSGKAIRDAFTHRCSRSRLRQTLSPSAACGPTVWRIDSPGGQMPTPTPGPSSIGHVSPSRWVIAGDPQSKSKEPGSAPRAKEYT